MTKFDKELFLKQGAIFGHDHTFTLMWGELKTSKKRPFNHAIYCNDFFLTKAKPWLEFQYSLQLTRTDLIKIFTMFEQKPAWQPLEQSLFSQQFCWIQKWFEQGLADKVVPYVFEKSQYSVGPENLSGFIASAVHHERGYLYGFWQGGEGMLGLSPEVLVQQADPSHFKTMALAGTCDLKEFEMTPHCFLENQKEIDEHEWVVRGIRQQLKNLGSVQVGQRGTCQTSSLVHFHTPIDFQATAPVELEVLIRRLHPTPALGCSPKQATQQLMSQINELVERDHFGAPFGLSKNQDSAEIIVAIRNLSWDKQSLKIGSGCGVIPASQESKEWSELFNKRNSVKEIFGVL